jgi:ABC-type transporter Mla MlaB component
LNDLAYTIDHEKNVFFISGVVLKSYVSKVYKPGCSFIAADNTSDKLVFDCSAVSSYDSSALALMLSWIAYAKKKNQSVFFRGVDLGVIQLAKLSDVDCLLIPCLIH